MTHSFSCDVKYESYCLEWGHNERWCSWLRHCATGRKVAGSIWIFHWHNPSGRTVAQVPTQSLTEVSTRGRAGVKATDARGWQTYHFHEQIILKSGSLNLLEPSGPVKAYNWTALPLPYLLLQNEQFEQSRYKQWCSIPYYMFRWSTQRHEGILRSEFLISTLDE